jgi:hypothetical protein
MLAAATPEQQKQMIGERLFPLVAKLQPELAGKITGGWSGVSQSGLLLVVWHPLVLQLYLLHMPGHLLVPELCHLSNVKSPTQLPHVMSPHAHVAHNSRCTRTSHSVVQACSWRWTTPSC